MTEEILGSVIHYESVGDGPALVFVHGLGGTSNVWHAQRSAFQKHYRVVTVDLPGSGRSGKTEREYSMTRWADQIVALAERLGLRKFVLVGHSMTTILAQNAAAKHPDRVAAIVLCGPLTEQPQAMRDAFAQRAEAVRTGGMSAVADQVLGGALTPASREAKPVLTGLYRELLLSNDPESYAAQCLALTRASAKADQASIRCPALILVGDQDAVTPLANCRAIAAAVPTARIRIVPATAHLTMAENPDFFNAALADFLASL